MSVCDIVVVGFVYVLYVCCIDGIINGVEMLMLCFV